MFDDDHYYMGGVLAELLAREGFQTTLVTPAGTSELDEHDDGAAPASNTIAGLDVKHDVARIVFNRPRRRRLACTFTVRRATIFAADATIFAAGRLPIDSVYRQLVAARREQSVNTYSTVKASLRLLVAAGDRRQPRVEKATVEQGFGRPDDRRHEAVPT